MFFSNIRGENIMIIDNLWIDKSDKMEKKKPWNINILLKFMQTDISKNSKLMTIQERTEQEEKKQHYVDFWDKINKNK